MLLITKDRIESSLYIYNSIINNIQINKNKTFNDCIKELDDFEKKLIVFSHKFTVLKDLISLTNLSSSYLLGKNELITLKSIKQGFKSDYKIYYDENINQFSIIMGDKDIFIRLNEENIDEIITNITKIEDDILDRPNTQDLSITRYDLSNLTIKERIRLLEGYSIEMGIEEISKKKPISSSKHTFNETELAYIKTLTELLSIGIDNEQLKDYREVIEHNIKCTLEEAVKALLPKSEIHKSSLIMQYSMDRLLEKNKYDITYEELYELLYTQSYIHKTRLREDKDLLNCETYNNYFNYLTLTYDTNSLNIYNELLLFNQLINNNRKNKIELDNNIINRIQLTECLKQHNYSINIINKTITLHLDNELTISFDSIKNYINNQIKDDVIKKVLI